MGEQDVKGILKAQVWNLEELVFHLEDRGTMGWEEYQYCQARLREVLDQLKRLERFANSGDWEG